MNATANPLLRPIATRFGLSCASITPFEPSGAIDVTRLVAHLSRCLEEGCTSLTLFGTTGEGASIGMSQRERALDAAMGAFGADRLLVGVMASAVEDAADQANMLLDAGGRGVLLAPPFYFKSADDEGLFAWFSRAIEAMHAPRGVFLYHLPSVTAVPLSIELIGRVANAFPEVIAGVKDSGGEWSYTKRLLVEHGDLHILVGDERLLARAMRHGASGAINGFSNFCARELAPLFEGQDLPAITALVDLLLKFPVTPGVKALVAHVRNDQAFARVAPPLVQLAADDAAQLVESLRNLQ
ncbi:MAG TPA: dihydrodipicolinate synthase family protein [Casimicrobiaceae bacterium]|nr:dihydrodipicolinate synthase family protein [Casimicrobiaceae bacterium]